MQGRILAAPSQDRVGIITGDDGQRYGFKADDLRNGPVREGQRVDFQTSGQEATDIYVVRNVAQRIAKSEIGGRSWLEFYFSPVGRVSRREFWLLGMLPVFGVLIILGWIPIIGWALDITSMWVMIALTFKRFHDCGYSGLWSFVGFIPSYLGTGFWIAWLFSGNPGHYQAAGWLWIIGGSVTILQFVLVYFRVGQRGPNKYGPDPLGNSEDQAAFVPPDQQRQYPVERR